MESNMAAKNFETMLDTIGNMSVIELADFVKAIEDKFGVSAAMPMMAAPAAADAAPKEEKTEFKVTLTNSGDKKIEVIKALRKVVPNLGLTEAKALAEGTPSVVAEAAPKEEAQKMKEALEAAGAKVELA
jgi:large subunit ribosomal protein L7/L12